MRHKFDCQLRRARRKWGLSQEELADLLELTRQHVSAMERAERAPSRDVLIACQVVFAEHIKELFPKLWFEAEQLVAQKLTALREKLAANASRAGSRKQQLVDTALERAVIST